ncbi:hypothetical protein JVU11DRAFT_10013 [Chiua virens]|nr:hypothetical protein JVU11DRAFT_10013 [Chiua virens]
MFTMPTPISTSSSTVHDNSPSQRHSVASTSGTSFFTARASPLTPNTPVSFDTPISRPTSTQTITPLDSESVTPKQVFGKQITQAQELHLLKITGDTLSLDSNPVSSNSVFHAVNKTTVMHVVSTDVSTHGHAHPNAYIASVNPVGPPPPSPPASIKQGEESDVPRSGPMHVSSSPLAMKSEATLHPVIFEDPIAVERARSPPMAMAPRDRTGSVDSRETQRAISRSPPSAFPKPSPSFHHDLLHRASTDTRLSTVSVRTGASSIRTTRTMGMSDAASDVVVLAEASGSGSVSGSASPRYLRGHASSLSQSQSPDGYLQPPSGGNGSLRPARRNTTGGHIRPVKSAPQGYGYDLETDIEDDIQLHAEQIRRERKRAKAQKDAEEALTRSASRRRGSIGKEDENKVLVGNLIGEDHVNYVLMYNMLTGIRIAVSRCQAKIKRPLTDDDFAARHKYSFDIIGNELTPSAKYDFKFKDYAPWVFRELREDYFQLDPADYLLSLTARYILSELGSPGKSGSFFYFSRDYRFIIKTIRHSEHKFLLSILKKYYAHVKSNPHTLLSRFYGLHRVKLPRGRKIHFVIMNNLFAPHKDIHETYDLKGSTVGREYPEEKAKKNPRAVLKDLNWIKREKMLEFGPEKRALLTEQLRRDSEFLRTVHVMDYSLLVGIHHVQRGNRENVRSNTLKVFSPSVPAIRRKNTQHKGARSPEAIAMKRAMRESDPKRLGSDTLDLPEEDTGDRQQFIFYQDEGGMQATDEANQPMDTLYYLGIIDILTPYSAVKQLEHFWKGLKADRHKISPVQPQEYADRFFSFMKAIMRGGGGGERFKPE